MIVPMASTEFAPTDEQIEARRLFLTGDNLVVQARAGAAKTSTLQLMAEAAPNRTGIFTAFNKLIVTDAAARFPSNTSASTLHSLAFRGYGRQFAHRLRSPRLKSSQLARMLRVDPLVVTYGSERRPMAAGYLAGLVMRTVKMFCQTADPEPSERHVPYIEGIDVPTIEGHRTYRNNDQVRAHIMPAVRRAWADAQDVNGTLPYDHGFYLKAWSLTSPQLACDFLMGDELQDCNGPMLTVFTCQRSCQVIGVGDAAQQINAWNGATDALDRLDADHTTWLTRSFRFGPAVADVANGLLTRMGAEGNVIGAAPWMSVVAAVPEPSAVLTRTNAEAVRVVLEEQAAGRSVHLTGGADEVAGFAKGAKSTIAGEWTGHPDLACFETWPEVLDYVDHDEQGGELRLLVRLVDEYGPDAIITACSGSVRMADAEVVVSTAHRSKGMGFDSVRIAGDFAPARDAEQELPKPELMLMYVAATRAKRELDLTAVPHFLAAPTKKPVESDLVIAPDPAAEDLSGMDAKALTLRYGGRA